MVLGKFPVPGSHIYLDKRRVRLLRLQLVRVGVVWTYFSLVCHCYLFSPALWETALNRLKYWAVKPKVTNFHFIAGIKTISRNALKTDLGVVGWSDGAG